MTRFFIVDDSQTLRRSLRLLIEQNPEWMVCAEAVDGREAVERVAENHPDLIILDFSMPVMNGIQAALEITKLVPDVPILLCTLYISSELVNQARRVGIQGAVSKAETGLLIQGINALLRRESFYSTASSR